MEPREELNTALWTHLGPLLVSIGGALLTLGVLSIFAFAVPLVIKETVGKRSEVVRAHAVESLNFALSMLIYALCAVVLAIITFGLGLLVLIPLAIADVVLRLIGSVKASHGELFRYPLTIRFVR